MSLYADDVFLFLRPEATDISVTLDILNLFGEALGLRTNLQKCSVLPIRCEESELEVISSMLHVTFQISHADIWDCLSL